MILSCLIAVVLNASARSATIVEALGRITPYVFLRLGVDEPAKSVSALERAGLVTSNAHGGHILTEKGRYTVWLYGWWWDADAQELDIPIGSLEEVPGTPIVSKVGYRTLLSVPVHVVANRNVRILATIGPAGIWRVARFAGAPCLTLANDEKPFEIHVDLLQSGDTIGLDVFHLEDARC